MTDILWRNTWWQLTVHDYCHPEKADCWGRHGVLWRHHLPQASDAREHTVSQETWIWAHIMAIEGAAVDFAWNYSIWVTGTDGWTLLLGETRNSIDLQLSCWHLAFQLNYFGSILFLQAVHYRGSIPRFFSCIAHLAACPHRSAGVCQGVDRNPCKDFMISQNPTCSPYLIKQSLLHLCAPLSLLK